MARRQYQSQFDFSGLPDQLEDEEEEQIPQIQYGPGYNEPQPQTQFDFSGLPDQVDTPVTDMDIPRPQTMQITPQQAEPYVPPFKEAQGESVLSPRGIWERFRSPLTDIGKRITEPIGDILNPNINPDAPYLGQEGGALAGMGPGVAKLGGATFDEMSAPINLAPAVLSGGASLAPRLGLGALSGGLTTASRIASAPTAISGMQKMRGAQNFTDWGLGALETTGGFFGMRGPKKAPNIGQQVQEIIDTAPPGIDLPLNIPASEMMPTREVYDAMQSKLAEYQARMRAGTLSATEIEEAKVLNKAIRSDPRFGQPVTTPTARPVPTFEEINARMMELYEKGNNGTLTGAELTEAQSLNKLWREHPDFGKPTAPIQKVTGVTDPNFQGGMGDPELAGSVPYGPTGTLGGQTPIALPKDLAGAKPRANLGGKIFIPQFESDVDKALYIIAQSTPSKRDADYMKFLVEATGLDETQLRQLALQQKQAIKQQMLGASVTGDIPIKRMWTPETQVGGAAPTAEALATQFPAGATTAKPNMPDYSPASEMTARQVLASKGIQVSPDMTNKQVIDAARRISTANSPIDEVVKTTPEIVKKNAPNQPIKDIGNGEFIHEEYPDYVLDADGNITRTVSGKPVNAPEELKKNLLLEVLNTPRSINASMDLSFPLRQGITLAHKPGWWKAWGNMVKGFGSQKAFDGSMASIMSKPNYKPNIAFKNAQGKPTSFADWAGLAITDQATVHELEHMRSFAEKVPGIKQIVHSSNRGYIAFANKLRSDVFDSLVDDFTKAGMDPRKNKELAKQIAGFVNSASGRGDMKSLERYMEGLNIAFFSPRLQLSRAQMAGKTAQAIFSKETYNMMRPSVRREYLKSMLTLGGAWATMAGAAHMAGADVSLDPTSTDFMKVKIGNTRLDPGGGFQQFIVLAARMAAQQSTSSTSGETSYFNEAKTERDPTSWNTLGRFTYNKLAPIPRAAVDLLSRNQRSPFDIADTAARLGSPILVQDVMEILTNEGVSPELLSTIPTTVGIGAQTYGEGRDFNRRMIGPNLGANWRFPQKKKSTFVQ